MSVGLQRLRDDPDGLRVAAQEKREDPSLVDRAIAVDSARRRLSGEADALRAQRKDVSAQVGASLSSGGSKATVEGLRDGPTLSPLQNAFLEKGAVQCGFCIPGQLMAADDLLRRVPHPSHDEIEEGLAGNLCRCGCYYQIFDAVEATARGEVPASDAPQPTSLPHPPVDQ